VANRDQERLTLLVRAGDIFHQSLDVAETLNNVARLAIESFADICIFDLIDERSDRLFVTAAVSRDPDHADTLAGVGNVLYIEEFGVHPVVRVTQTGTPFFLPRIDEETLLAHAASRRHEHYMRRLGYRSKIVVPVVAQDRIFGALTFVRTKGRIEFDKRDLTFAVELGRRAGLAVANAKQYHREQYVAETLQRSLLPQRLPSREGIELSAHYRPGSTESAIGGDWYDAFENSNGEIVISIGDVTGKGVDAARLMVLMRQAIRVAALDFADPRRIADTCNRLLLSEGEERFVSAFIGVIDPETHTLRYVSAGHAPPLLRLPNRDVQRLQRPSPPLGAFWGTEFELHEQACPEHSMLVLYTDGVLEATRDVVFGEKMLEAVLSSDAVLHAANSAEFIERAIANVKPRDDIAILVVNFARNALRWQFEAADARSAYAMREEFFKSLLSLCDCDDQELATCGVIFSELIGNAVRHAPGPLSVSLEQREGSLLLHVIDKGPGFAYHPALPPNIWSESGRGLFLISRLARWVEVERVPGLGSHVVVALPVTPVARETVAPLSSFGTLERDDYKDPGVTRQPRATRTARTETHRAVTSGNQ
jgi:serine phosphatase RsbU (regulator of sigma subunit)